MEHVYVEHMGDSVALPLGESLLGRDAGCLLRFSDPSVSRRHARLIHRQDEVFLEDLGSANGTLLNGRTIAAPIRLRDGDVITIGKRDLKVSFADPDSMDSTLVVKVKKAAARAQSEPRAGSAKPTIPPVVGRRTTELPAMVPPLLTADERCPRCSAVVSSGDRACGNCHYDWGDQPPIGGASLNRRRHERRSIALHVTYTTRARTLEATTLDLSESGVFVCSPALDPVGTQCTLTLEFPDGVLSARGIIRRLVEPGTEHEALVGAGIELHDLAPADRARLASLIKRLAAED